MTTATIFPLNLTLVVFSLSALGIVYVHAGYLEPLPAGNPRPPAVVYPLHGGNPQAGQMLASHQPAPQFGTLIYFPSAYVPNPFNPPPRRSQNTSDWFLPAENTDVKFTNPIVCGEEFRWVNSYKVVHYSVTSRKVEYYQIYYKENERRNCVVKAGTREEPGKFIRLFEENGKGHMAYCFAPNGDFLPTQLYDKLSRDKMVEEYRKSNANVNPLKPSHQSDIQTIATPSGNQHAETSVSTSNHLPPRPPVAKPSSSHHTHSQGIINTHQLSFESASASASYPHNQIGQAGHPSHQTGYLQQQATSLPVNPPEWQLAHPAPGQMLPSQQKDPQYGILSHYETENAEFPFNPPPRRNQNTSDWFLPDNNTEVKFTKPNEVGCGVGEGWLMDYLYKVFNVATRKHEYYERYQYYKEDRKCVVKAITKDAPGKFIRFFVLAENGGHVAHCFAPNGDSLQCGEYDRLSLMRKNEQTNLNEHMPSHQSQIDEPSKPSHLIDLQTIENLPEKEHAETSASTSNVDFPVSAAQQYGLVPTPAAHSQYGNFIYYETEHTPFNPQPRRNENTSDWFLPDKNTDLKFTDPSAGCGQKYGWPKVYSYNVYNQVTEKYESYQRYQAKDKICVANTHTNEAPGKFIRLIESDRLYGGHLDYCFAPNGDYLPTPVYNNLSQVKMEAENGKANPNGHTPSHSSQIDEATNPLQPLNTSHSFDLQQIANPSVEVHAGTSASTSNPPRPPRPSSSHHLHLQGNTNHHSLIESASAYHQVTSDSQTGRLQETPLAVYPPPIGGNPQADPPPAGYSQQATSLQTANPQVKVDAATSASTSDAYILNGTSATSHVDSQGVTHYYYKVFPNAYPLSVKQLTDGMNQLNIEDNLASSEFLHSNNELKSIVERYDKIGIGKLSKKFFYYPSLLSKGLLKSRKEILVDALKDAVGYINSDSTDLIELIVTARNEEKAWYRGNNHLGKNLCPKFGKAKEVKDDATMYKQLLAGICENDRQTGFEHTGVAAINQKHELESYFKYEGGTEAFKIPAITNYSQLRKTFQRMDVERFLLNKKGHFWQLVEAVVDDVVKGRPYYLAKLLNTKLQKLMADNSHEDSHKDVQRILLSRFGIDLTEIEYEFNQNFAKGENLKQTILGIKSDKVSGYVNIIKLAEEQLKTQNIKKGGNISI